MPNIKFSYFYRDGGNYKKFCDVVFANPDNIDLTKIESIIHDKLIDDTWFYAEDWKLPELFFDWFDFKMDPTWHEFEAIEYTDEDPNTAISLAEFIDTIEKTKML